MSAYLNRDSSKAHSLILRETNMPIVPNGSDYLDRNSVWLTATETLSSTDFISKPILSYPVETGVYLEKADVPLFLGTSAIASYGNQVGAREERLDSLLITISELSENVIAIRKQLAEQIASKDDLRKHHEEVIEKLDIERSELIESVQSLYQLVQNNSIRHRTMIFTLTMMAFSLFLSFVTFFAGSIVIDFFSSIILLCVIILFFFLACSLPSIKTLESKSDGQHKDTIHH